MLVPYIIGAVLIFAAGTIVGILGDAINNIIYNVESDATISIKLPERYEGYGGSVKRVMEQKEHEKGIIGVVADIDDSDEWRYCVVFDEDNENWFKRYHLEKVNMEGLKPPYMMLSNHMYFIDFQL